MPSGSGASAGRSATIVAPGSLENGERRASAFVAKGPHQPLTGAGVVDLAEASLGQVQTKSYVAMKC